MASLVVSGDTSGAITLSAPAVAGTNTLSLPAQTATLATLTTPSFATTIGVGGATAAASGAGITFPATQSASSDANTLDDYEEGTWTPAYGGGANITGTPTFSQAVYTKVGRLVTLSFKSVVNTTTGNTNTYIVATGLPFTIANVMALYSMSNNNVRVGIGQCYSSASLFIQYPAESGLPSGSDDWYSTLIYYV